MSEDKVASLILGHKLREIRRSKGIKSTEELAVLMRGKYTYSTIARRETGASRIDLEYIADFCSALNLTLEESALLKTSTKVNLLRPRNRFADAVSVWSKISLDAKIRYAYTADIFSYYLQTYEYARAILEFHNISKDPSKSAQTRIDDALRAINDKSNKFRIVCHENALYFAIGNPQIMIQQLDKLRSFIDEPHIEFRILPRNTFFRVPVDLDFNIIDRTYCFCENRLDFSITDDPGVVKHFIDDFETIWAHSVVGPKRAGVIQAAIEYYKRLV